MFNNLSDKLNKSLKRLRGVGRLTEDNIKQTLREVRIALLEADVALEVIKPFLTKVQEKALGQEVTGKIRPGEAFIKVVNDELTHLLGEKNAELNLNAEPPIVILMAGLQGSGKTTTTAKLAKLLMDTHKKSVLLASCDVYRPAAIEQLKTLSQQIEADWFPSDPKQNPVTIAKDAIKAAKKQYKDVVIIDTAGRLHIDDTLMAEIKSISDNINPHETLLVVDSMAGQDAANMAKQFNATIPITGVVLTKTDGDARGGAALSMAMLTEKPIKFIGTGEKIDALSAFHPDRMASRILGMGDIVSLVEDAKQQVDKKQVDKLSKKLSKGKRFDFNDFLTQLEQMQKMGGMKSLLTKLPGMPNLPAGAQGLMDDKKFTQMQAIVFSMTPQERSFPMVINGSRKKRIATGSGTTLQDVNRLLKQFTQMQKMLKKFKGGKMNQQMKQLQNLSQSGKLPPELLEQLQNSQQ